MPVKFLMGYVIGEVQSDQLVARECYLVMLAIDEKILMMNIEEMRTVVELI